MMPQAEKITIPPPSVIRDRLTENLNERRVLRRLLRISVDATEAQRRGDVREQFVQPRTTAVGAC